ncbi:dihydropteroate synthase [Haladaptatus salinisoli]|uniref:dihydropteroate synthase n=1 Tax=Haladaptatus salinisoli TaxID=2884876 RepID=UPI001D0B91F5|nr:dihydropteroate synthase [Haladaptatus salinisoli]
MEYHEAADFLTSLQRRRPEFGTETTARMLSHFGHPQADVDFVQVAGSNGKGSTTCLLESVLRTAGLEVGVFTSPCLNDFREQIRVGGRPVPKERVAEYVERIRPCLERLRADDDMPTHFEVLTALAVHHFGVEGVDVGILEVGIGGRYDATSAVDPVASAVTSVSLEHTDLLGDTVEEIARDKAQVAPTGRPLVTGADGAALEAIRSETDAITVGAADADVIAVENGMRSHVESSVSVTASEWTLETNLSLLGQYQATNAGVAAVLARQVAGVDASTMADGLRKATWPGRFEIVSTEPMVVLDGSHNPGAAAKLGDLLGRYDYDDLHVVFAAMADKDYEGMVAELPAVDTAFVTRPDVERAEDVDALADAFGGRAERVHRVESVPEAAERALAAADETDFVLVTGSLYAVAEARDRWTRLVVPKGPRRTNEDTVRSRPGVPEATADDIDHRVLATSLRRDQAERVGRRFEAVGGTCVRSDAGAPGKLVETVLSGTVTEFRELADAIQTDGLGLRHLARQFGTALDGPSPDAPFDAERTAVMGILNVTPDSFHDGGEYDRLDAAVERAERMVAAGADIVDVGGESTRPGAEPVPVGEEVDRVVPVIESISSLGVPVSVDTRKAAVAEAALDAGADIVNDVSGLSDPEMRFVVADHDASLVLMHSLSAPVDPDRTGPYDDVVEDVLRDLSERILLAERAGVDRERIVVDPGCGFGKDAAESFELVDRLSEFRALGCPVMVGHSRKSMFERVGCRGGERLPPTLAVTALAAERGADVVRVHDVAENAAVVRTVAAANDS